MWGITMKKGPRVTKEKAAEAVMSCVESVVGYDVHTHLANIF